ncbi:hypothetical protein C8R44DRAFT_866030 [Mycena epipterygia]|nr:hypothetical protein C8R44DRAFT_866030 [Mycena epipterygia]
MSTFATALELINDASVSSYITTGEALLYRAYLVIFGFYLHVLRTHGIAQHRFLAASTILLFILGTAHCALQLATTILGDKAQLLEALFETTTDVVEDASLWDAAVPLFGVSNSLTEAASGIYVTSTIFIFRCYVIWGYRRKIVIFPMILTLAVAGLGYSNVQINLATDFEGGGRIILFSSVATSLFNTFILMGLTVGRIWWLARAARHVMGRKIANRYYTACAMILESGALYCIGGIAFLVVGFVTHADVSFNLIYSGAVLAQLVVSPFTSSVYSISSVSGLGVAPTIIARQYRALDLCRESSPLLPQGNHRTTTFCIFMLTASRYSRARLYISGI